MKLVNTSPIVTNKPGQMWEVFEGEDGKLEVEVFVEELAAAVQVGRIPKRHCSDAPHPPLARQLKEAFLQVESGKIKQ